MGGTELNTGMCITASLKSLLPFHKTLRIVGISTNAFKSN